MEPIMLYIGAWNFKWAITLKSPNESEELYETMAAKTARDLPKDQSTKSHHVYMKYTPSQTNSINIFFGKEGNGSFICSKFSKCGAN